MSKASARGTAARIVTAELIRTALSFIPPDVGHDERVRIAFAVYDGVGDAGADPWLDWAGSRGKPDAAEDRAVWKSARKPGGTKVGTLFGIAQDHGFKFPEQGEPAPAVPAAELARRADEKRRQAEADAAQLLARREISAQRSLALWEGAKERPARGGCPYLDRKQVKPYGLRFLPGGTALVPMRDAAGKLWSVQRLLPKPMRDAATGQAGTDKLYGPPKATADEVTSSRKLGLWHMLGDPAGAAVVLLCEGYATGASVHEATSRPTAVCFDAGNLVHVAAELRELHPVALLLVCGDDDHATAARRGKNPGRDCALKAAAAVHSAAAPAAAVFPTELEADGKDFNDLATTRGLDAVRTQIEAAIAAPAAPEQAPLPKPRQGAHAARGGSDKGEPGSTSHRPAEDRPAARRDPFLVDDEGVWHIGRDRQGDERPAQWLCGPLQVTAITRDDSDNSYGYLLEFVNRDGNARSWAAPAAMFNGDGGEWCSRLRDMGLRVWPGAPSRNLIAQYIETRDPQSRVTSTDRVGWHGPVYVLPAGCIGAAEGKPFVFQSEAGVEDTFRRAGPAQAWRDSVARLAEHNSRLVFAICAALAGPLLLPAGLEGGGFHYRGKSSMGKTTALKLAASVWGRPSFMQSWRSTANALEATAAQHSDCVLVLDEIGEVDPREIGSVAYMLANGQEKGRNTRSGINRKRRTWRLLFLSSGEISLADHMSEGGKRVQAGMQVRMVELPLDAGAGMGGIEELHGHAGPAELADAIAAAAARNYGTTGRAWLEWICAQHAELSSTLRSLIERNVAALVPGPVGEQVRRVARRFAVVGAAGELASGAGLTGWPVGHATWAAKECFDAWLHARGHVSNNEDAAMLGQVQSWFEKNADALLTWWHRALDDHRPSTAMRAGMKRLVNAADGKPLKLDAAADYIERRSQRGMPDRDDSEVEYFIFPEAFKRDVCKGFDPAAVAALLCRRGHLVRSADRYMVKPRLPGLGGSVWCYQLKASLFADDFAGL